MSHTTDTAALATAVREHGYAIWPGFLTAHQCAALRHAAQVLANGQAAYHYPKSTRVWDLYRHGELFADLLVNTRLGALRTALLGEHHLLSDYSLNIVHPGQPIDDWHIDYPYNEMPTLLDGAILGLQCVLALDEFTNRNGATQLVPESHRPPQRPPSAVDHPPVSFTCQPGTLLVLAAATWHRSGCNASPQSRTAVLLSFVERWIRPMTDPPEPGSWAATEAQRVLLGIQRPPDTINGVPV